MIWKDIPCFSPGTISPFLRRCLRPSGRSGRCLPFRGAQSFPPRGRRVYSCARRRTLASSSVVAALARLRFGSNQPVSVSAACTHVAHRLWVCVRDVEQYRFVAILRRRSISEASPLDYDVHLEVPFGVERSPLSTWWRIDTRLSVRESACTRDRWWLTCAPD